MTYIFGRMLPTNHEQEKTPVVWYNNGPLKKSKMSLSHPAMDLIKNLMKNLQLTFKRMSKNENADFSDTFSDEIKNQKNSPIMPVWDDFEGWRFFYVYPDNTRVEVGPAFQQFDREENGVPILNNEEESDDNDDNEEGNELIYEMEYD